MLSGMNAIDSKYVRVTRTKYTDSNMVVMFGSLAPGFQALISPIFSATNI